MKNSFQLIFTILCIGVLAGLTATDSFGQSRNQEERGRKIELTKNAKKKGYKIRLGDGKVFARLNNVINPFDGKPLEGLNRIFYQCTEDSEEIVLDDIKFFRGNTKDFSLPDCFTDGFESGDISAWSYSGS